jgi:hypothetical protein
LVICLVVDISAASGIVDTAADGLALLVTTALWLNAGV